MKKVIIVTRSTEYGNFKEFQDAIDARNRCKYNEKDGLIRFLAARKKWEDEYVKQLEKGSTDQIKDTYEAVLEKECEAFGVEELANAPFDAIRELMVSISDLEPSNPYASFYFPDEQSPDWEVILVLCDKINIAQKESVNPVGLFLNCLCDDLEPFDTTDNVLYIHAEQIGFWQEGILVDNHALITNAEKELFVWLENNKSSFKRIGYFVHERFIKNGIFENNILQKDFLGGNKIIDYFETKNRSSRFSIDDV